MEYEDSQRKISSGKSEMQENHHDPVRSITLCQRASSHETGSSLSTNDIQ